MAYELIETITVGSGFPTFFEFVSIPQDGIDLKLVISGKVGDSGGPFGVSLRFNGLQNSGKYLSGNGSAVSSSSSANLLWPGTNWTGWSSDSIYISNYTTSQAHSYSIDSVSENNDTASNVRINAGLTLSTDPITSIRVTSNYTSEHTTASLYKIS